MSLEGLLALGFEPAGVEPTVVEAGRADAGYVLALERPGMGTKIALSLRADSPDRADTAAREAFARLDRLTALLNRYDSASALSTLNDAGSLSDAPPALTAVVDLALAIGRVTAGAFDPTVAPLVNLFGGGEPRVPPTELGLVMAPGRRQRPDAAPDPATLAEVRDLIGREYIRRQGRRIGFARQGMSLTLDGVAKGWIVDAMATGLHDAGIHDFLLDAGGDIRAHGRPEPGRPWTVAIQDPDLGEDWPDVIALHRGAVATSGSYEFYFDPGRTRHHIVAGGDAKSPNELVSVTVCAPDAATADALATAVFVLGPDAGSACIESMCGCECLLVTPDGDRHPTSGWAALSLQGR
ncbi:MAG: FAD:protein FMN transferase [marine benthic group bacterium]|jgi:thiamine biosynthesis lipoprotein|nr:FAD:protein FMN transferase [Gemmatimonadota bacterium]MCL7961341.1 FAD:protein FMN transferase [Candidatus Carthagonibacter metallireducens]MCL7965791.1 FAD:protein FMN transferase [Gemmatimonadota bacterium]MCL7970353.1 FAD:protein FMN transferase [Gemmatimonadota bacterium]MCL7974801.1 FAD:protein FMN transferase [Gemmatimonadota bacterium]